MPRSKEPPAAPVAPLFVSTLEAARLLGLSRTHVYELLDRGDIESRRIGRRRLVKVSSLHEFVDRLPADDPVEQEA